MCVCDIKHKDYSLLSFSPNIVSNCSVCMPHDKASLQLACPRFCLNSHLMAGLIASSVCGPRRKRDYVAMACLAREDKHNILQTML